MSYTLKLSCDRCYVEGKDSVEIDTDIGDSRGLLLSQATKGGWKGARGGHFCSRCVKALPAPFRCVICGAGIWNSLSSKNGRQRMYCSLRCNQQAWRNRAREKKIRETGIVPRRGRPRKS